MNIFLRLTNYAAFYLLWLLFLCVKGEGLLIAILATVIYFIIHFVLVSDRPKKEGLFMVILTLFGITNESVLSWTGILSYEDALCAGVSWLTLVLWFCFSSTYWHAFAWLESFPFLAMFLGALGAPVCYYTLAESGKVTFLHGIVPSLFFIGLDWAIVLPGTLTFSRWFREGKL